MRGRTPKSIAERIRALTAVSEKGCWEWRGALDRDGYGHMLEGSAHTLSYVAFKGPIRTGLELDHLCKNRRCCNPDHLEPVTHKENIRRGHNASKTHCINGHPLAGTNLANGTRQRQCRICANAAAARYQKRKRSRSIK